MRDAALFRSLIVSRRRPPAGATRLVSFGLAAALYVAGSAALVLTPLLVVESVEPPRAGHDPIPVFRVRPPTGPPGDPATRQGQPRSGAARGSDSTAPSPAHTPSPPAPRPVVVPLAPPTSEPAVDIPLDPGEVGSAGEHVRGGGDHHGPGDGKSKPGCEGCTGNTPGKGDPNGEDAIFDERDPRIIPPVVILSTRALPQYPDLARRARVEGTVILLISIDREGRVGEVEVLRSPDLRYGFDLAAIEAVKQWRYRPAMLAGRPVAVQASVLVEFAISR